MAALTRNQTKTFFRNHVGVADNSVIEALSREGIDELEDLVDFDDNAIKMVAEICGSQSATWRIPTI